MKVHFTELLRERTDEADTEKSNCEELAKGAAAGPDALPGTAQNSAASFGRVQPYSSGGKPL